ncbi:tripartite tricarboxylate transporter substrate binding protein [Roseococcus sp. SYP-B2431]|uniref:Bug family tripartite tricarboxylate transporter substrate binding protein n=1 Tax=Roseococcus sp. SYP-B2431 TaxID=2496640 RepID=UPI0010392F85|nr:tripartite tricarboxylate transporter substrate-binding protein [Roseococcus sp. SYP-B2431]TCH99988.1 tripartite tricarboxylate transporter substrate binding protein [Roseococcus sp. SYP-B2431]
MKPRLLGAALAALLALAPPSGRAQDVRFLCGFAAGGTCDILTRLLADKLGPVLNQRVVVENRTGAGGLIAAEFVARSAPDGNTVFLVSMANMTVMPVMPGTRMPIDVDRELTPIGMVANVYNVLVTGPQARFQDVPSLVALARAEPGRLTYASTGNGSSQHLAAALFERMAGVSLLHVPFRGGAPAIVEMTAGRVDMMFGNMPEFLGQIRGGGLRAVAYGAPRPSPLLPLPLIGETVPGFEMSSWFGVAGPANLPPAALDRWVGALRQVGADPDFQRRMTENAMEITLSGPDEFRTSIQRDRARWADVIQRSNIRAE